MEWLAHRQPGCDGFEAVGADGIEHGRIAERGGVAAHLQFEPVLADAAGGIDRQDQLQIDVDRRLGPRRRRGKDGQQEEE